MLITAKSYLLLKYYLTPLPSCIGFDSCKKRNFVRRFWGFPEALPAQKNYSSIYS
jgi:hypothetical protein